MTALIDGDSIIYKAGFALEEEIEKDDGTIEYHVDLKSAKDYIDGIIDGILFNTDCSDVELWIGERGTNFRYKLSEGLKDLYKHNRKDSRKPDKYKEMLNYIRKQYKAKSPVDCEVDDVVCFKKAESPDKYVLCAIDKDVLYQTEGTHYNYGTGEFITVDKEFAIWFAYYQTLIGDTVDGYKGAFRVGPAKAMKILGTPNNCDKLLTKLLQKGKVKEPTIKKLLKEPQVSERTLWARVLRTYRKSKQTAQEALITMRLAQMHQLHRSPTDGKLKLRLWTPIKKGFEQIETLPF